MEIHYFPIRGLAEMSRVALALADQDWVETCPEYSSMKSDPKNYAFAVLPAFKDGEVVLSQSLTILRYVGRKFALYGADDLEAAQIDQLIDGVASLRSKYLDLIYQHALADDKKAEHWALHGEPAEAFSGKRNSGAHWSYITSLLTANCPDGKGFAVGGAASIADAVIFDVVDLYLRIYESEFKANFPELVAHHDFVASQPSVAKYLSTKRHEKINGNTLG